MRELAFEKRYCVIDGLKPRRENPKSGTEMK
jgi:hypothetical protein